MINVGTNVRRLVLVCTNCRDDGRECCGEKGGAELHRKLKEAVSAGGGSASGGKACVRVLKTSCLDRCSTGASVVIMPDNIWLGQVEEKDIPEIVSIVTRRDFRQRRIRLRRKSP